MNGAFNFSFCVYNNSVNVCTKTHFLAHFWPTFFVWPTFENKCVYNNSVNVCTKTHFLAHFFVLGPLFFQKWPSSNPVLVRVCGVLAHLPTFFL